MQYRIYCLNDEGRFSQTTEIELASDRDAMAYATSLDHGSQCEVWNGARLVGKIPPRANFSNERNFSAPARARS
jgi:hypothetical protein